MARAKPHVFKQQGYWHCQFELGQGFHTYRVSESSLCIRILADKVKLRIAWYMLSFVGRKRVYTREIVASARPAPSRRTTGPHFSLGGEAP